MDIKKIFLVFVLAFLASSAFINKSNAQVYKGGLIDKTVAAIGNEFIMLSQIEEEVQISMAQGVSATNESELRCQILENLLIQKLLLTQAKLDSLNVRSSYVEGLLDERIDRVISTLGGQKQAEEYFKMPIFRLRENWRERLSEQDLTEQEKHQVMSSVSQLTPSEIRKYYRRVDKDSLPIIPTQYRYSQILLYPQKENAVMATKERLLEFRQKVLNGEKFSTIAALYSEDNASALRGGELRMASKNVYWPAFSDAAIVLKPGQISQIVETPDGFHLIQMIEKNGDMFNARHILLKPKFTAEDRSKAFARLDSIKNEINKGEFTFEMAARKFSQDPKTYLNGGQVVDEETGGLFFEKDRLNPTDFNAIKSLKIGEISQPIETTSNDMYERGQVVYKIIKLEEIIDSHRANVDDDFSIIQNIANVNQQNNALKDFISQKQKITYIRIDDMYKGCDFEYKGWLK